MRLNKIFLLIVFSMLVIQINNDLLGQEYNYRLQTDSLENSLKIRKIFIYSSVGTLETLSVGIGYQIQPNLAIALDASVSAIGGTSFLFPNTASGFGIRTSYYIPFLIFNNITFESILYLDQGIYKQSPQFIKGYFLDLTIGKEIIDEKGLRVFYGVGLSGSHPIDVSGRFSVSFKIGLNFNFN
jgi:hypothetical protein